MPESNKNDARKRLSNAKNVSRGGTDPLPAPCTLSKKKAGWELKKSNDGLS
jgi:hypothetical protein